MRKVDEMRRRAIIGRILQAAKRGSLTEIFGYECRQVRSAVRSEVLTLGFEDESGAIVLAAVTHAVPNGKKMM